MHFGSTPSPAASRAPSPRAPSPNPTRQVAAGDAVHSSTTTAKVATVTIELDPSERHDGAVEFDGMLELFTDRTFALSKLVDVDFVRATGEWPHGTTLAASQSYDVFLAFGSERVVRVTIKSVQARCDGHPTLETLPTHVRDASEARPEPLP